MISLILSGTLCAVSVGLAEEFEGVLGSSFFSSSAVIKLLTWSSFNSLFTSAYHILVRSEFTVVHSQFWRVPFASLP